MRIGSMADSGSNRHPKWFLELHRRKQRRRHSAEELAADTGADKSAIFKGLKGLILPEVEKEGRHKKSYFLEEDLQWLDDEINEGRVYPIRAAEAEPAQDPKALHETFTELGECIDDAKSLGALDAIDDNDAFRKAFRKSKTTLKTLVDLLEDIRSSAGQDAAHAAEAGLLALELFDGIGKSQKRWEKLKGKSK